MTRSVESDISSSVHQKDYPVYRRDSGLKCSNPKCITNQESEIGYIKPAFKIVNLKPLMEKGWREMKANLLPCGA